MYYEEMYDEEMYHQAMYHQNIPVRCAEPRR
jgi:hypothetical protein